jgi:hypothetical protein
MWEPTIVQSFFIQTWLCYCNYELQYDFRHIIVCFRLLSFLLFYVITFFQELTEVDVQVLLFLIWGCICCKVSNIFPLQHFSPFPPCALRLRWYLLKDFSMLLQSYMPCWKTADWMGFCNENECRQAGFVYIWSIFVFQSSSSRG